MMGEFLDLIVAGMDDTAIRALFRGELPSLSEHLRVEDGRVTTKLAMADHVYLTFPEMAALYWFIREHDNVSLGPGHDYNATPAEILRTRASLYLGPWDDGRNRGPRVLVPQEICDLVEHGQVWRKTKKALSGNGRSYYRKVRSDETSGVPANPNGYQTPCPNDGSAFLAYQAGFSWDWESNLGRTLYRCGPCSKLFTMGDYETPDYAALAEALAEDQREADGRD